MFLLCQVEAADRRVEVDRFYGPLNTRPEDVGAGTYPAWPTVAADALIADHPRRHVRGSQSGWELALPVHPPERLFFGKVSIARSHWWSWLARSLSRRCAGERRGHRRR